MAFFRADSKLSEVVFADCSVLPLFNCFGICLGVGDTTIGDACRVRGLNTGFLLALVNTYLNDEYMPHAAFDSVSASDILVYLRGADAYCAGALLPNVQRHFVSLGKASSEPGNAGLMLDFFSDINTEIMRRIGRDREGWLAYEEARCSGGGMLPPDADVILEGDAVIEDKVNDLASLFVKHLDGRHDSNLCTAVATALFTLAKHVRQNNRIRKLLLTRSGGWNSLKIAGH